VPVFVRVVRGSSARMRSCGVGAYPDRPATARLADTASPCVAIFLTVVSPLCWELGIVAGVVTYRAALGIILGVAKREQLEKP